MKDSGSNGRKVLCLVSFCLPSKCYDFILSVQTKFFIGKNKSLSFQKNALKSLPDAPYCVYCSVSAQDWNRRCLQFKSTLSAPIVWHWCASRSNTNKKNITQSSKLASDHIIQGFIAKISFCCRMLTLYKDIILWFWHCKIAFQHEDSLVVRSWPSALMSFQS